MANELEVLQGNDVPQRTFKIKIGGVIQPISSFSDYHVYVYQIENNKHKVVAVYKKTPGAGTTEKQINLIDTETIGFVVGRDITKSITGDLYAEIRTQMAAGSEFESSLKNAGAKAFHVAKILESTKPKELV